MKKKIKKNKKKLVKEKNTKLKSIKKKLAKKQQYTKKKKKNKKKNIKKIKSNTIKKLVNKKYIKNIKKIKFVKNIKKIDFKKIEITNIVKDNFFKMFNFKSVVLKLFDPLISKYNNYIEKKENEKIEIKENKIKEKEKEARFAAEARIQLKEKVLKDEIRLEKERTRDIKNFLKQEQALIRKEQAERQRKFLIEIKLQKQIERFRAREIKELENLERISLKEQREDYTDLQIRIEKLKEKYRILRDQKIRERVESLGVKVLDGDDRSALLEKEKEYNQERQKIEFALESYYRSMNSLVFQINKKFIPKHRSILRCIDQRFEDSSVFIRWDDSEETDFLLLAYIKDNNPQKGIIIEDRTNPEKNISKEYKTKEIFKASDYMVDALVQMLAKERDKRKKAQPSLN